ncbi:hypothetical protein [Streptomyces sp. NBC_00872]|uniref:hypothetical protein n=1 Tax=Streptomyces sp. NBC_00872 TaxID=2903686 RepID=UPI0038705BEC|nr:hypothetical protein OG214_19220 [Streptomyces sp. NBC_00872]
MGEPGAGTEPGYGDGDGEEREQEQELRILLERAVPRLPAPEERLRRVRERVRRARRRRRTGGAAAAAVTGLVLAGTFLPGVLRGGPQPQPQPLPPAAPGPSVTEWRDSAGQDPTGRPDRAASQDPTASPTPTPTPTQEPPAPGDRYRFEPVAGLILRLPEHWQALDMPEDGALKLTALGYVSSEPLTAYGRPCVRKSKDACLPVRSLRPGGALVTFEPLNGLATPAKVQRPPVLHASDDPSPDCRVIGGTRQFTGLLGDKAVPATAVAVTLCVSGDAPGTAEDVSAMVTGADFGKGTGTASPPTRPPSFP